MQQLIIRPNGAFADLEGNVPPALLQHLVSELSWVGADNLNRVIQFFDDEERIMYPGCMYRAKQVIDDYCKANGLRDFSCTVQLPTPPKPKAQWRFSTAHLGKPNPLRAAMQKAGVDKVFEKRFCIFEAVPGYGKTVCFSDLIARFSLPTVVVVRAKEPFDQAVAEIEGCLGIKVGQIQGRKSKLETVNVMMIQTWLKAKERGDTKLLDAVAKSRVVIIDECHNAASDGHLEFLDSLLDPVAIIGFSATPFRHDDRGPILHARLGEIAYSCTYKEAVDAEILVPIYLFVEHMPTHEYGYAEQRGVESWKRRKQFDKVRKERIIENKIRNRACLDFVDYCEAEFDASCAIITGSIPHIENLCAMDPTLVAIHGETKPAERREIWEALRRKDIMRVATTLMDEATNIRSLGGTVMADAGRSKVKHLQRLRNLRTFEGPTSKALIDKKEFGLTYMPYDHTDFLRTHSKEMLANYMEYVNAHSACRHFDLGEYQG